MLPAKDVIINFVLTGFKYSVRIMSTLAASAMFITVVSSTIYQFSYVLVIL